MGIGLQIAIPFLIKVVTGPDWHPSVADLTIGKTGATVEPQTPRDSQPLPESASSPTREVRPIPTYERIAPVAPPKYEAAPLLREVKPVPGAGVSASLRLHPRQPRILPAVFPVVQPRASPLRHGLADPGHGSFRRDPDRPAQRQVVLDAAYQAHPGRFVRRPLRRSPELTHQYSPKVTQAF